MSYYTSAVRDDDAINDLKKKISQIPVQFSTAMNEDVTTICPYVFKKLRSSEKTRNVDINLTIDVMRFAYSDAVDTIHLVSGDGDYLPLIQDVMRRGKEVVVSALSSGLNPRLVDTPDLFISLDSYFFTNQPESKTA